MMNFALPNRRCRRTTTSVASLPRLLAAERQCRWADKRRGNSESVSVVRRACAHSPCP
jgi:hypothetical protein